jgi:hypothetical protein
MAVEKDSSKKLAAKGTDTIIPSDMKDFAARQESCRLEGAYMWLWIMWWIRSGPLEIAT